MTATLNERLTDNTGFVPARGTYKIAANTLIRKGWQVALNASGRAVPADTIANGAYFAVGKATATYDNRTGSALGGGDGACDVEVEFGVNGWLSATAGDAIDESDIGKIVYMLDNQTVALTDGGGVRGPAGVVTEARDGMIWVYQGPHVAGMRPGVKSILLSLYDFREVDANSDVGNIVANGGVLASDTTPILRGNAAETQELSWATGNVDPIALQMTLPVDVDGTQDVTIDLYVNSGATDAATFTVETGWDGGALVSDSADDAATKSATTHKITATVAAADVPNTPGLLTVILTPAAHATNAIQLLGARINYAPRAL